MPRRSTASLHLLVLFEDSSLLSPCRCIQGGNHQTMDCGSSSFCPLAVLFRSGRVPPPPSFCCFVVRHPPQLYLPINFCTVCAVVSNICSRPLPTVETVDRLRQDEEDDEAKGQHEQHDAEVEHEGRDELGHRQLNVVAIIFHRSLASVWVFFRGSALPDRTIRVGRLCTRFESIS